MILTMRTTNQNRMRLSYRLMISCLVLMNELNLSNTLEGILYDSPPPKLISVNSNNYTCTADKCNLNIDEVNSSFKTVDMKIDSDKNASDKHRPDDEEASDADSEKTDESARIETGLKTGDF